MNEKEIIKTMSSKLEKIDDKEEWKKSIEFIKWQVDFYSSMGSIKRFIWKKVLVNITNKFWKKFIWTEFIK